MHPWGEVTEKKIVQYGYRNVSISFVCGVSHLIKNHDGFVLLLYRHMKLRRSATALFNCVRGECGIGRQTICLGSLAFKSVSI